MSPILAGAEQVVYVDVDDTIRETHGYRKQGAAYGYSRVKGLNAQLAIVSTPLAAPVIAATRLRKGNIDSGHGAARLIGDTLATLRRAVPTTPGLVIVRADSAYFRHDVIAAATAGGARFSVTARMNKAVVRAIAGIDEASWTTIRYRDAIYDEVEQRWISEAEVAEVPFTAFTSHRQAHHVTARLIVRRVKRLNPHTAKTQGELLPGYRYHPIFTNTTLAMVAGRGRAPRPRHHRSRHRRPQGRPARPRTIGEVHRERRLARPRLHRVQPDPGRCPPRVGHPGQGPHRDRAPHPHPGRRQDREPGPPVAAPPPRPLALAGRTRHALHRRPRPTRPRRELTNRPYGHDQEPAVEKPGTPADNPHPHPTPLSDRLPRMPKPSPTNAASADRG